MHPLAGGDADHLLAELAQQHALPGDLRVGAGDADDVALLHRRFEAEQQVGRRQVEEVQRVGLEDLPVVHQPPDLLGGGGDGQGADHRVEGLGGGQVVAHRADAAQALHHHRHFPVGAALDEFLEAAELDDVQPRLAHVAGLVEQQRDLAVALDARDGVDGDPAQAFAVGGGFQFEAHGELSRSAAGRPTAAACGRPAGR
jgi:hypothetical protein